MRLKGWIVLAQLVATCANAAAHEYTPAYDRIRAGLQREPVASRLIVKSLPVPLRVPVAAPATRVASPPARQRASLWRGAAIGAGIGAAIGGLLWAPSLCSSNDPECTAITVPIGLAAGGGIGAAVGAIVQAIAR